MLTNATDRPVLDLIDDHVAEGLGPIDLIEVTRNDRYPLLKGVRVPGFKPTRERAVNSFDEIAKLTSRSDNSSDR